MRTFAIIIGFVREAALSCILISGSVLQARRLERAAAARQAKVPAVAVHNSPA